MEPVYENFCKDLAACLDAKGVWHKTQLNGIVRAARKEAMLGMSDSVLAAIMNDVRTDVLNRIASTKTADESPAYYNFLPLQEMANAAGWQEEDGPAPGIFALAPVGQRCLWSCIWLTSKKTRQPDQLYPIEALTLDVARFELEDALTRLPDGANWQKFLWDARAELARIDEGKGSLQRVRKLLETVRPVYKDFIWVWDPPAPATLMYPEYRPGWKG